MRMANGFFGDLDPSLQALLSQAGSGVVEVEAVVGCSSLPGEAAQVAGAGDNTSTASGNSVAAALSAARGDMGVGAEVSVIDGGHGGESTVVSGWKRRPQTTAELRTGHSAQADAARIPGPH